MDFNSGHESTFAGYAHPAFYLNTMWPMPIPQRQDDQRQHLQNFHPDPMPSPEEQFHFEQHMQQSSQQTMFDREAMMGPQWQQFSSAEHPQMTQQQQILSDQQMQSPPYSVAQFHNLQQTAMAYGQHQPHSQSTMNPSMQMNANNAQAGFIPYSGASMEPAYEPLQYYQNDLHTGLIGYPMGQRYGNHQYGPHNMLSTSPTGDSLEVQSSSGSESDWNLVPYSNSFSQHSPESFANMPRVSAAVSNPSQTLHIRTESDSSQEQPGLAESVRSFGSFEEVQVPLHSPQSESTLDFSMHNHTGNTPCEAPHPSPVATCSSPSTSPTSPTSPTNGSPPTRRRKELPPKQTKVALKKPTPTIKKSTAIEKKVGRRRGPLRPEQRIQAGEIRKLRACLRCKFLKKTCDKGDPCAGCQPSHARLWQVPCTRIDIKDIGYFVKDWKADYERHVTLGNSIANIKGYASQERTLFITHGYGYVFGVQAREVFVRDDDCFNIDWVESCHDSPREFEQPTARLTIGMEGIDHNLLSQYLDSHIDHGFEDFIRGHFEGTKFLTDMLFTAHRYFRKTKLPVIRKALKLVLAYNLTLHITMVEGIHDSDIASGTVEDDASKHCGKTLAPVMINFQVKHALAMMWRELQKDVLEELSALFSSVYSGEKLKNWPTIFMLASLLLAVWEEIQFDSHYRSPDPDMVKKFCNDMEATPVGVIVGLFSAISQKLPSFSEWDTSKHHHLLNSENAICQAMDEVRNNVLKHEDYLKSRADCKFDRNDFDSLSNKFVSKLVIRAN